MVLHFRTGRSKTQRSNAKASEYITESKCFSYSLLELVAKVFVPLLFICQGKFYEKIN